MIIPAILGYLGFALLLYDTAARSWRMPGRVDEPSRMFARPAPAVGRHRVGPAVPSRRLDDDSVQAWFAAPPAPDMVREISPRGEPYWIAEQLTRPQFTGATEGWSPLQEVQAAERVALPLDDADEWLAERTRSFEHALSRIGARRVWLIKGIPQRTLDDELRAFQQGSMALHAYRAMILDGTGEFTTRQHMQLEALLAA